MTWALEGVISAFGRVCLISDDSIARRIGLGIVRTSTVY
jgi:hypothetical protein